MKRRSGVILLCVLICLGIVSTMILATVQSALVARREVHVQAQRLQTNLLLDAGIHRAVQQIQKSSEYQGESWDVTDSIDRYEMAMIEIQVTSLEEELSLLVQVTARTRTADSIASQIQKSHQFVYKLTHVVDKSN